MGCLRQHVHTSPTRHLPTCGTLSVCCCTWFDESAPESWWADMGACEGPLPEACRHGGRSLFISLGKRLFSSLLGSLFPEEPSRPWIVGTGSCEVGGAPPAWNLSGGHLEPPMVPPHTSGFLSCCYPLGGLARSSFPEQ